MTNFEEFFGRIDNAIEESKNSEAKKFMAEFKEYFDTKGQWQEILGFELNVERVLIFISASRAFFKDAMRSQSTLDAKKLVSEQCHNFMRIIVIAANNFQVEIDPAVAEQPISKIDMAFVYGINVIVAE